MTILDEVWEGLIRRVSSDPNPKCTVAQLMQTLEEYPLLLGTDCSGTECPVFCFEHMMSNFWKAFGTDFRLRGSAHVFSCENIPFKQDWIKANFPNTPYIFVDASRLGCMHAHDVLTNDLQKVPACSMLLAGFSCKSASFYNIHRELLKACIEEEEDSTGQTFDGNLSYLLRHHPMCFIFENVPGLAGPNLNEIVRLLHLAGYVVRVYLLTSSSYKLPTDRKRLWILGILRSFAVQHGSDDKYVIETLDYYVKLLNFKGEMKPLQDFILPDSHPAIQRFYSSLSGLEANRESRGDWRNSHIKFCGGLEKYQARKHDPPTDDFVHSYPGIRMFTERQFDMVTTCNGIELPTPDLQLLDVSQDVKRSKVRKIDAKPSDGSAPTPSKTTTAFTFTPKAQVLMTDIVRTFAGVETLSLQGLEVDDEIAKKFSDAQLCDLGGNAFAAPVCSSLMLACRMTIGAIRYKRHNGAASADAREDEAHPKKARNRSPRQRSIFDEN